MLAGNAQSLLEALIEDIAQDAAIGQYDRQCPTPTKITVTRMMFPKRHQHSLNGLKPGPHTLSRICYNDIAWLGVA